MEDEIILLSAINNHIGEMVNFEILDIYGKDPHSEIRFKSATHQKIFNILLVDFLSETDEKGPIKKTTFLSGLIAICESPCIKINASVNLLNTVANDFKKWLDTKVKINIWFPSLNKNIEIHLLRYMFLKLTGNISKHNYVRTMRVAKELIKILQVSEIHCNIEDALLALPSFYDRFHVDILYALTDPTLHFKKF